MDLASDILPPTETEYRAALFPRLTEEQLGHVAPLGKRRALRAGEEVFRQGDEDLHLYVVLAGQLDLVRPHLMGEDLLAALAPGEFTGEVSLLSRRRSLVSGRMRSDGELLDVPPAGLRKLVVADAELSELLMRTFVLRRVHLINHRLGDTVLVGARNSAGTIRLMDFLTRNGHPYSYLDLEEDRGAQAILDRFQVGPTEVPVVICRRSIVLRNPGNDQVADVLGFNVGVDLASVRDLVVVGA
ncbi:MAG TPA: cyclic nucleotide-binding domain-containing protein, partial [Myxococcaceae bacterium]